MSGAIYLAEGCRLYVLVVLLAAACGKFFGFARFRSALAESFPVFRRAEGSGASLVAGAIVAGECCAAALMLTGGEYSRVGLGMALVLFLLLTSVVVVSLVEGRHIRCSCFGGSERRISGYDLVRNLLFLLAAAVGLWGGAYGGIPGTLGGLAPQSYLPLGAVAILTFLLSAGMSDIAALLSIRLDEQ